jgi:hypothetical protein
MVAARENRALFNAIVGILFSQDGLMGDRVR